MLTSASCSGDDGSSSGSQSGQSGTTSAPSGNTAGSTATAGSPVAGMMGAAGASGMAAGTSVAGMPSAAGMQGAAGMMPDDHKPTWSGIYQYELRACRVDVCHGGGLAGINMATKQGAYDSLVDHVSDPTRPCAMLGKKRVVPG